MKTFIVHLIILLTFVFDIKAVTPEDIISVNFGSTISTDIGTGAVFSSLNWNTLYKGNSPYLLDNNGIQSSCFLKTNAVYSIRNEFNDGFSVSGHYALSVKEPLNLTFYDIPYQYYNLYIYFVSSDIINNKLSITVNGMQYDTEIISSDGFSKYSVIHLTSKDKLELTFNEQIGISAIQIVESIDIDKSNNSCITEKLSKAIIYPTLARKELFIDLSGYPSGKYSVEVINIAGRIVSNRPILKSNTVDLYQVKLNNLLPGNYSVSVTGSNTRINQQIVIR